MKRKEEQDAAIVPQYNSGVSWKSIMAILFSAFFIGPVMIYSNLIGVGTGGIAVWGTLIFFAEIFLYFRQPLNRHEITLIYTTAGLPIGSIFLDFIFRGYFASSPIVAMFKDPYTGQSLRNSVPWWYAPRYGSEVYLLRTFLNSDWLAPILVSTLSMVLTLVMEIALATIIVNLYVEVESLPFPLVKVDASICETLGDREAGRMKTLMISAMVGLVYGAILYAMPMISAGVFGIPNSIIPIPWVDLNPYIELVLPGASFGIATDLLPFIWGSIFPSSILISMVIGSFSTYFVGNHLALRLPYFSEWQAEWTPGMSISLVLQRSTIWVWAGPHIGFTIGVAVWSILRYRKQLVSSFRNMAKITSSIKAAGYFSLKTSLLFFLLGSVGSVILFSYIVPGFPIWLLVLMFVGYPFLMALVVGRIVGETSFSISIPYAWEGLLLASGFQRIDPWFAPHPIGAGQTAGSYMSTVKLMTMTNTRPRDYFKFLVLALPLSIIVSFAYTSLYWIIAPIPSVNYPATVINWPVRASMQALWYSRQINVFKPDLILAGFVIVLVLASAMNFVPSIPFSIAAFVGGTFQTVPVPMSMLIGSLVGRFFLRKKIRNWDNIKALVAGGATLGEGISMLIAAASVIVAKSMWTLPY